QAGTDAHVDARGEVEAVLGAEKVAVPGVVVRAIAVDDVLGAVVDRELAALVEVEDAAGAGAAAPGRRGVVQHEVVDQARGPGAADGGDGGVAEDGLAGTALELVEAIFELVQHRQVAAERPPGPG